MIITVGGIKGGSGKTTIATNLAVIRSIAGRDVLLIDADDQETATDFTTIRSDRKNVLARYTSIKLTGSPVRAETLRLKEKYEDVIIDTGGRDTISQRAALAVSDILLVPFVPRSFDVWTIEKVSSLVTEMSVANPNLKAFAFINRADPRGQDNQEAAGVLQENNALTFIDIPIGNRKSFSNASSVGLSVVEIRPQDPKAIEQITALYRYVFDIKMIS